MKKMITSLDLSLNLYWGDYHNTVCDTDPL